MNGLTSPATAAPESAGSATDAPGFDLVVADASWTWTEKLFSPLAEQGVRVLLFKACDWRTAINQKRPRGDWLCPLTQLGDSLWQRQFVLPPGWMKTYPRIGMRPLAWAARVWHRTLDNPKPLALAISYPHYLYLRDLLQPSSLMYYNMDDYGLYWESRKDAIRQLEGQTIQAADLSVFCAKIRADEWSSELPGSAAKIIHLPHGAPLEAIPPRPQSQPAPPPAEIGDLPRPLLGFVGSLEDRLDWNLLSKVADAFSTGSVLLIGRDPDPSPSSPWYADYLQTVSKPNVHRLGWKTQGEIARYNASFDVCLIPYLVDHPFNRVACPTKVMDYMATSRPVVSTAIPECQLYKTLFSIADNHNEFVAAIHSIVAQGSDDGRAEKRWHAAREATWGKTSSTLLDRFQEAITTSK